MQCSTYLYQNYGNPCYAELWTGVELLPEADRPAAAETLDRVLRASRVLLVADNVAIAREAARAQAAYRRRGGRREVLIPDFGVFCISGTGSVACNSIFFYIYAAF